MQTKKIRNAVATVISIRIVIAYYGHGTARFVMNLDVRDLKRKMSNEQPLNCQIHKAVEDVNRYLATDKTAKVADICGMMNPAIAYIMRHGSHFVLDASIADMVERDRNNVSFTFPVRLPYSVISLEHDVKFPTNEEMTEFEPGRQITVFTEIELTDRQMTLYEGVRREALEAFCFIRNTKFKTFNLNLNSFIC